MAIISADEWRKKQGGGAAAPSVPSGGGIISAEQFSRNQPTSTIPPDRAALIAKSQENLKRLQAEQAAAGPVKEPSKFLKAAAFIQSLVPFNQQLNKALTSESTAKVLAPVQGVVQKPIPEVNLGESLPAKFASELVNMPAKAQKAAIKTGQNLEAIGQGKDIASTKLIADFLPAADFVVSIATLGGGKAAIEGAKALGKTAGKNTLKEGLKLLARNAKNLGPAGAAFGLSQGMQADSEAPDVISQFQGALPEAAVGAVAATGLGAATELGAAGVKAGLRTLLPADNAVMSQFPNAISGAVDELPVPKERSLVPAQKPLVTPPPGGLPEPTVPGGQVLERFATEKPFALEIKSPKSPLKIDTPETQFAEDVIGKVANPQKAAGPYILRDKIPGEQFDFVSFTSKNPLSRSVFDSAKERVRGMGDPGKRLALGLDRQQALSRNVRGETADIRSEIVSLSKKLSDKEKVTFYDQRVAGTVEPKYKELDDLISTYTVQRQAQASKVGVLINDATGETVGDPLTYIHHTFNEKGRSEMQRNSNTFYERLGKENGKTAAEMRSVMARFNKRADPVAGFEKELKYKIPPEYLERDPARWINHYEDQFADRVSGADVFGADYKAAYDLAGQIGQVTGSTNDVKLATDMINESLGKITKDYDANVFLNKMVQNAVRAKLSILTASQNMSQGISATTNSFGPHAALSGLLKGFTKEGKEWAREVGVGLGEGFYKTDPVGKIAKVQDLIWRRTTGFPLTEDLNFVVASNGAKDALEGYARALIKNPTSKGLKNKLELWGIDADQVIKNGSIPRSELKIATANYAIKSIFPKVAGSMPTWVNSPITKATYMFNHYTFNQTRFVTENFKLGKAEGFKALARMALSAAVLGEIPADLASLISGKERPENIFGRLLENEFAILAPLPYAFGKSAESFGGGFMEAGGAIASGFARTTGDVLKSDNPVEAGQAVGRGYLRGDLPMFPTVPQGALLERTLFKKKKKTKEE